MEEKQSTEEIQWWQHITQICRQHCHEWHSSWIVYWFFSRSWIHIFRSGLY